MNKKVLTAIVSSIIVLALIVVAVVCIIKGFNPKKDDASGNKSSVSDSIDKGDLSNPSESENEQAIANPLSTIIEIPIEIKRNPGVWGGQIILKYDTDVLEYHDFACGEVFDECNVNAKSNGTIYCVATNSDTSDVKTNGTVVTLKFIPKPKTKGKIAKVEISKKTNFTNIEENLVEVNLESKEVKIN